MDPKVCGELLRTHRKGLGDDVEALHGRFPSGRVPAKAPRWDLADIEGYGGGNCFSLAPWMFSEYVGIYRRKKCVGGRPRGARDRGRALQGGALPFRGGLGAFLSCTPGSLNQICSKNDAPEGFIPFGLRLIFLFFEILK